MSFEYPPRLGWCTKHASPTVCKDCEIEHLTAELDQVKYDRSIKHDMAAEQIDELTKELSRYKQGVEVEVTVDSFDYGDTSFICEDIKLPSEFRGQRVRVLVMKEEG